METEMKNIQTSTIRPGLRALESKTLYRTFAFCTLLSIIMILPVLLFPLPPSHIPIGEQLSLIAANRFNHLIYWGSMLILMCLGVGVNMGLSFLGLRTYPVLAFTGFVFSVISTVLVTTPKFIQFWSSLLMAHSYLQNPGAEVTQRIFAQYSQWMVQPLYTLFQGFETCGFTLHLLFLFPIAICLLPQSGRYRVIGVIILIEAILMAIGLGFILVSPGLIGIAQLWNKTAMSLHIVLLFIMSWVFLSEAKKIPSL